MFCLFVCLFDFPVLPFSRRWEWKQRSRSGQAVAVCMSKCREYRDKSQKKELLLLVASDVAPGIVRVTAHLLEIVRNRGHCTDARQAGR